MSKISNEKLYRRYEKARKKRKSERGIRGKVKKFILDRIIKKEISSQEMQ